MSTQSERTAWYWTGLAVGLALALTGVVLILTGILGSSAWFAVAAMIVVAASQIVGIRKERRRHIQS